MKKMMLALLLAVGCLAVTAGTSAWAGEIAQRQFRQAERIRQGVHTGALTPAERQCLQREQHHIRQVKHRAWSDGRLNGGERHRLHRLQAQASRHIYALKHNGLFRP